MQDAQQTEDTQATQVVCEAEDALCAAAQNACTQTSQPEACRELVAACPPGDSGCHEAALAAFSAAPMDPTANEPEPVAFEPVYQGLADLITAGGPIIVILAALSLISLAIIVAKITQFLFLNIAARSFVEPVASEVKAGAYDQALELLSHHRGPVARVMEAAVRGRSLGGSEATTREEVTRVAQRQLETLEAGLPYLSLVATISPLLGLLGTVLGMIDAFQPLEGAGDRVDPAILSGGIWEALLTTAAGLSVAIPAAAVFTWLQRSVDVVAQRMEDAATRVFTVELFGTEAPPSPPQADTGGKD